MYLQKNLFWARMRMCPANKNSCCLLLLISNQTFLDSSTLPPFARQANPWKLCCEAPIFLTSQETICCRRGSFISLVKCPSNELCHYWSCLMQSDNLEQSLSSQAYRRSSKRRTSPCFCRMLMLIPSALPNCV